VGVDVGRLEHLGEGVVRRVVVGVLVGGLDRLVVDGDDHLTDERGALRGVDRSAATGKQGRRHHEGDR
jgi:hypothetical protein